MNLMKKTLYPVTLFILAIFLSACASTTKDIEVETASDPKVNLQAYKTYAWLGSAEILNDPEGKWQPAKFDVSSDIKFLIDSQLRDKGLTEVADQDAEIAMSFFTGVDMAAQQLQANPDTNVEIPENVPKAALIVAALDIKTGYVIWMGVASGDVKESSTVAEKKARIAYTVKKMFNPRFYDSWFK
ncbi:MAG TPA: DUF4136 domain-containing protein [Methyloprofundus sp.]|uniref:DUF4136 domain-containing protein n=1 Tax=Methyloprofundus sp. TaxID=2020875 RepID=UPI001807DE98|nr:DUF4136 domain-containing protein [Methyloprofundus sp.]HIG65934.1 DUF4136 domain-containing protein [Methyloprofundus sp.]HIL78971.1 DUF4136 domain-containing protein [Methylococcales bacterium]